MRRFFLPILIALLAVAGIGWLGGTVQSANAQVIPFSFWQSPSGGFGNALRFRAANSAYLSRTSASGNTTTWTFSTWMKRTSVGAGSACFFGGYNATSYTDYFCFNGDAFYLVSIIGGSVVANLSTVSVLRDPSAWYHIVLVWDTGNATSGDHVRLYVNGARQTLAGTMPGTNQTGNVTAASRTITIGRATNNTPTNIYVDAYFADTYFVDGQALDPAAFAQTDTSGQWTPKAWSGTYGTNGFHLNFSDASAATATAIGKDSSGNGNNFTPNNISVTAGASNDALLDGPVSGGNYATLNPLAGGTISTLSNGNLTVTGTNSSNFSKDIGTIGVTSGKWYFEATVLDRGSTLQGGALEIGWTSVLPKRDATNQNNLETGSAVYAVYEPNFTNGFVASDGSPVISGLTAASVGDVIGTALDADVSPPKAYFFRNGAAVGSASGYTVTRQGPFFPTVSTRVQTSAGSAALNFGQRAFAYTPPTGYGALNTNNLAAPSVSDPSPYFKIATYTGNGSYVSVGEPAKVSGSAVANSLRFKAASSTYLTRTPAGSGNLKTWTWSAWFKRGNDIGAAGNIDKLFSVRDASTTYFGYIGFINDRLDFASRGGARLIPNEMMRDPATWYHLVVTVDTTQATAADRLRMYINGRRITSFSTATYPGQNTDMDFSRGQPHAIGRYGAIAGTEDTDGYLADVYFIDGQGLDATAFGQADSSGNWAPKAYSGSYGTNGFHLDFADTSDTTAATLGKDASGNNNNWTPVNFTVDGSNPFQFKPTGFQIGNNSLINTNANNYVSWNWKKGATPGFDVVTYTGAGAGTVIPHSLGVTPSFVMIKSLNNANHWIGYHAGLSSQDDYIYLSRTNGASNSGFGAWTLDSSNATVVLGWNEASSPGVSYVAYLWSEVPGFSKFGRYTGNGSADGPFIYTGFKPAYVMVKRINASSGWSIWDNARNSYNVVNNHLEADNAAVEDVADSNYQIDMAANGFKLRGPGAGVNASGGIYIYTAFAESPFKEQASKASLDVLSGLRFNSANSARLVRSFPAAGNFNKFTLAFWAKRGNIVGQDSIAGCENDSSNFTYIRFHGGTRFNTRYRVSGTDYETTWAPYLRDPAAWHHYVYVYDRLNATVADRQILYIDGVRQPTESSANPTAALTSWNGTRSHYIGWAAQNTDYMDGNLADMYYVDGQALAPSSFGEANSAGLWAPKAYSGSYGVTGFHLEFLNPAAPGTDTSGQGNNWTATNFAVGTPIAFNNSVNMALSNGGRTFHGTAGGANARAYGEQPIYPTTSKVYFEVTSNANSQNLMGFGLRRASDGVSSTDDPGAATTEWVYIDFGELRHNNVSTSVSALSNGEVGMLAFDPATGKLWFGKQGTWFNSGNPATGANPSYTVATGVDYNIVGYSYSMSGPGGNQGILNTGQAAFAYTPPSGFSGPVTASTSILGDSPTNNYALMNSLNATSSSILSNDALTVTNTGTGTSWYGVGGTMAVQSGKWYYEASYSGVNSLGSGVVGFADADTPMDTDTSDSLGRVAGWYLRNDSGSLGEAYINFGTFASFNGGADAPASGTVMLALDMDSRKFWVGRDGTWFNSGDPAAGTNPAGTFAAGKTLMPVGFPVAITNIGSTITFNYNFGQGGQAGLTYNGSAGGSFKYTPPSGFKALSTSNMPASAIAQPSQYFKAATYTGNASTQTVNVGFQPDLTWIKDRSAANNHVIEDSARAGTASPYLSSNTTTAETSLFDLTLIDNMTDVPNAYDAGHGNYATLNPLAGYLASNLAEGNLRLNPANTSGHESRPATIAVSSGKWYWEVTPAINPSTAIGRSYYVGMGPVTASWSANYNQPGDAGRGWGFGIPDNAGTPACVRYNGTDTNISGATGASTSDVFMVAFDLDNGKAWFGKNGTWFSSGNPASGANPLHTGISGTLVPVLSAYRDSLYNTQAVINFGQRDFAYTPPSGFKRLQTYNLANSGFVPDLVMVKNRSSATDWAIYDSVRGPTMENTLPTLSALTAQSTGILSFQNGGFTAGSSSKMNTPGDNYVAYMFKKGVTPGFDLEYYIGGGSPGDKTVTHNLGVTPSFIFEKSNVGQGWRAWHSGLGTSPTTTLFLSSSDAAASNGEYIANITSSSFVHKGSNSANSYVSYIWAEVPGFSKFGSYVGNNSGDGPFIYTGFKPAFVLVKSQTQANNWWLYDSTRSPTNEMRDLLRPDLNNADSNQGYADFVSNGFKIRNTGQNSASHTYLYWAIAEQPFKYTTAK